MNPRRGHESMLHLEAKTVIAGMFAGPRWSVFLEQRDTDVLLMHIRTRLLMAVEIESSPRNVRRNIERDVSNGCDAVAVVTLNPRHHRQIENRARRHGSGLPESRLQIFSYSAEGQRQLIQWIDGLVCPCASQETFTETNPNKKENTP